MENFNKPFVSGAVLHASELNEVIEHMNRLPVDKKIYISSGSALKCAVGNSYRIMGVVTSLNITLPNVSGVDSAEIHIYLTTGTNPSVSFTNANVAFVSGYQLESSTSYKITALWNGFCWLVSAESFVMPNSVEPLKITILEGSGVIGMQIPAGINTINYVEYSTDKVNWTRATYDSSTTNTIAMLQGTAGDCIYVRGNATSYANPTTLQAAVFFHQASDGDMYEEVEGDIISMLGGNDFSQTFATFAGMFAGLSLKYADKLILPDIVTYGCYVYMFQANSALERTPVLPAAVLAPNCYQLMFDGATHNIKTLTMLATDVSAESCLSGWLQNITGSSTKGDLIINDSLDYNDLLSDVPDSWNIYNQSGVLLRAAI